MGNIVIKEAAPNDQPVRLNRDAFFATGATVDHGDHLHEFRINEEQVVVRNLRREENGEMLVTDSERTMSKEDAFSAYLFLMTPPELLLMLMLAEMLREDAQHSASQAHEESDIDELSEESDDEEEHTHSPRMS